VAIYLKYDGVPGNVTTKGFEGQIEVDSVGYGAGRAMGMSKRSEVNRGHAEPFISEIVLHKAWDDVASSKLLQDSFAGVSDKKALITFTTTSKNVVFAYMTIELEKTVVSDYSFSSSGGDAQPLESLKLNYTKITVTPYEVKDGKATKKDVVTYSLPQMQANS
jgi:type VI secretion system secreted protein Hcp